MFYQVHLKGEITFETTGNSFSSATAYIRLEETSRVDAAAVVVAEQVVEQISHRQGSQDTLPINLLCPIHDRQASYGVTVHIDIDGSKEVSQGDYITMESYLVLTLGYPDWVSVCVRQIWRTD